jgi:hypothetical protein
VLPAFLGPYLERQRQARQGGRLPWAGPGGERPGHRLLGRGDRSPTTTGKIERFRQSLRKEFLAERTFPSLEVAQNELDGWVSEYNTTRPHQALEMATPADRFRLAPLAAEPARLLVDEAEDHPGQWILPRVASNGVVSVDNQSSRSATPSRERSWTYSSTTP